MPLWVLCAAVCFSPLSLVSCFFFPLSLYIVLFRHFKPTNTFQYIHYTSHHPPNTKAAIIRGELLRYQQQCSDPKDFKRLKQQLITHFLNRGYPFSFIHKAIQKSIQTTTTKQTSKHNISTQPKKIYPFIIEYDARRLHPKHELSKHLHLLQRHPATTTLSNNLPLVAYRNFPNLGKQITKSALNDDAKKTAIPNTSKSYHIPLLPTHCQRNNCFVCSSMINTNTFKCTSTRQRIPIQNRLSCDSKNIIYVLQCQYCGLQYVGQTTTSLRTRMTNHLSAFRSKQAPRMLLYRHFDTHGAFKAKIIPLTHSHPSSRMATEEFWIKKLNTRIPNGLNNVFL